MPESVSQAIKAQFPGSTADELDHIMPLELGGSNEHSNLRLEPADNSTASYSPGSNPTNTDPLENALAKSVQSGAISLVDAWKAMASAKGVKLPEQGGQVPQLNEKGIQPNTQPNEQPKPSALSNIFGAIKGAVGVVATGIGDFFKAAQQTNTADTNLETGTAANIVPEAGNLITQFKPFDVLARVNGGESIATAITNVYGGQVGLFQSKLSASDINNIVNIRQNLINKGTDPKQATILATNQVRQGKMQTSAAGTVLPGSDINDISDEIFQKLAQETNPETIVSILKSVNVDEAGAQRIAPILARAQTSEDAKAVMTSALDNGIIRPANGVGEAGAQESKALTVPESPVKPSENEVAPKETPTVPKPPVKDIVAEPKSPAQDLATRLQNDPQLRQTITDQWKAKQEELRNITNNKVSLRITGDTVKQRVQSAIVNSERLKNEIAARGQEAYTAGQALKPSDIKLALQYEEGTSIADLAKQSSDPKKFTNFMTKLTDYYDFRLAADRAAGGSTGKVPNYLPHNWDLSNPEKLAEFNDLARQKGLQPYDGFRAQPRVFKSYQEGKDLGFVPKNTNILQDLKQDINTAKTVISKQALKQGLVEAAPDQVSTTGFGKSENGKPFINSNVSGLEGMSYDQHIHKQLKGYTPLTNEDVFSVAKDKGFDPLKGSTYPELWNAVRESGALNTIGTLYDHANQPMKRFLLNFSGFHSINISASYAGASIFNPIEGVKGLTQSIPAFFSEKFTQRMIDGYKAKMVIGKNYSVFDAGMRAGVDLGRELSPTGVGKYNPLTFSSRAIFNRELYTLKLNLVNQVFGNGKINPESPQGRAVAQEINQIMGEMNNHIGNINPNIQKWASRLLLAPQFTESKYKVIGDAFTKGGAAGARAWLSIIGKSLIIGTLATLGTKLMTGKFPNLQQILLNYTIAPKTQTNLKNPQGTKQDIGFPQTFISEPGAPISGLVTGNTQPLTNYAMARLAPALSDAVSLYTNKDFYGNPIINPYSTQNPVAQAATNLGVGDLPIGAQNVVKVLQGQMTPTQAGINIAGLHTSNAATPSSVSNLAQMIYTDRPTLETEIKKDYLAGNESAALDLMNTYNQKLLNLTIQAYKDAGAKITDMNAFITFLNTNSKAKGGLKGVYLEPPTQKVMTDAQKKQGQPLINKIFPSLIQ
jgi:hypothetical protein